MTPQPRQSNYFGMRETAHVETNGTWLEPEALTYPAGGFTRRARVFVSENPHTPIKLPYGELRVVVCSIPDSAFTIPARLKYQGKTVKGYISTLEDRLCFTPEAKPELCVKCEQGDGCKK